MREGWKTIALGDITQLVIDYRGKTPLKLGGDWSEQGYRALSAKNIKTGHIVSEESIRYVDESLYKKWMKDEVKRGDIFVTSEAPFGQIYYWNSDEKIVLSQRLFDVRIIDEVESKYVYYYMTSNPFQKELDGRATGTTVIGLRQPELMKCQIKLPPLEAQRRIASILSSLDEKIDLNNRINANLEAQAQALFKSWFIDFEPFKDGEFVDSELGRIPKGWKVGKLSDVAIINPKLSLKKGHNASYLDMSAMPTKGPWPKNIEEKAYSGGMKFQNRDTLMARITPCLENGKVAYVNFLNGDEIGFGSTEFIVMRPQNGILPELLYCLCREPNFVSYATKNMNGSSGRQRVSGETIGNYSIPIPPIGAITPLIPIFQNIMDAIANNGLESQRLAELRDTLLPRLMSGEIAL